MMEFSVDKGPKCGLWDNVHLSEQESNAIWLWNIDYVLNLFLAEFSAKLEFCYDLSQNYVDLIILSIKIQVKTFLLL